MRKRRVFALFLSLALLLCTLPASAEEGDGWLVPKVREAPAFTDMAGVWCADAVDTVCAAGLMQGRSDGSFGPSGQLTGAHIATICARLYDLLTGGDGALPEPAEGQEWYDPAYASLSQALDRLGAAGGTPAALHAQTLDLLEDVPPDGAVRRQTFAALLAETLSAADVTLPAINQISVVPDCKDPAVLSLYNAGILTGSDQYGSFRGSEYLNRGQAAAILARLADPAQRQTFTPEPFDLCADVLGMDGATVLLTVGGESVTAELFAYNLCDALCRGDGSTQAALEDTIRNWCFYDAPFQFLAEDLSMRLTAEEQAEAAQAGQNNAGYLGMGAAYWQYKQSGVLLNGNLRMLYWEKGWKTGEATYHQELEAVSEALLESAEPTAALTSLDLDAIRAKSKNSPICWSGDSL